MARKSIAQQARELRGELYSQAVIAAAEEEFAKHGFASTRMQWVARRAGVSVGLVYKLFESKDALFEAIHALRGPMLFEKLLPVLSREGEPFDQLRDVVQVYLEFCVEYPIYLRVQLQRGVTWGMSKSLTKAEQRDLALVTQAAISWIEAGIADGKLVREEPRTIVAGLVAVLQAYLQRWVDDKMRDPPEVLSAKLTDLFRRMYGASR